MALTTEDQQKLLRAVGKTAPGAWPNGTVVKKGPPRDNDKHAEGTLATVRGSIGPFPYEGSPRVYGYLLEFADTTMRKDEAGKACPETLGEYRDLCVALMPKSKAVRFLDDKIAESPRGRDDRLPQLAEAKRRAQARGLLPQN